MVEVLGSVAPVGEEREFVQRILQVIEPEIKPEIKPGIKPERKLEMRSGVQP